MKGSTPSDRSVAPSSGTHATASPYPAPHEPRRLRLRYLILVCPSCEATHLIDPQTPRQVFDPEVHRFACPTCLTVLRLLPYPLFRPEQHPNLMFPESEVLAAVDLVSHPLCAGIGVYDPVDDRVGGDQRGVVAQYLSLPVPAHPGS